MTDKIGSAEWWRSLRFGPNHLDLGDVRVTIGMQEEITDRIDELEAALHSIREKAWNEPCSYSLADRALKATEVKDD